MCRWVLIFVCTMYLYVLDVRVCVISVRLFAVHAAYESCRVSVYAVSVRVAMCASVFCVLCVYIYVSAMWGERCIQSDTVKEKMFSRHLATELLYMSEIPW